MSDFIIKNGILDRYNGPGGDVVIPDSVTSIGDMAFYNRMRLTSVTIPDSVTSIGYEAFANCKSLTSVTIGNSVTSIGAAAFSHCESLTSVNIPDSVTSIGCSAFSDCYRLTAVTIPDSVTSIEDSAFFDCTSLTSITIPDSVTSIGNYVFFRCRGLTNITFGSGITTMGKDVFRYCETIAKITMPPSVVSFVSKQLPFSENLRIDTPDISALPARFRICAALCYAEDGGNADDPRYESHVKYLKANAGKIVETAVGNLPLLSLICREGCIKAKDIEAYTEAVQKTGNTEAIAMILDYQNSKLSGSQKERAAKQKEKQADTVIDRAIARMDQVGITGLNFVVTGDVETFEKRAELKAFIESQGAKMQSSMSSKTDYLIMNDDSSNSEKAQKAKALGVEVITERKFNDMAGRAFVIEDGVLTKYRGAGGEVVIPDGVTVIGKEAFKNCRGLTAVTIPEGVTLIGEEAFRDCKGLISVKIPEGVTTIDTYAFLGCKGLTDAALPASVTTLKDHAFYGCESLTDFTIPDTVTTLGETAFMACRGLADDKGFLIIRNVLVSYFGKESEITIPDGVTKIGWRAFFASRGKHLVSVTIPDSVTSISGYAFSNNDRLTTVTIGNGTETISLRAFYACHALTTVTIGSGIQRIGAYAFSACEALTTISLPDKPIDIDETAFQNSQRVQFQKRST